MLLNEFQAQPKKSVTILTKAVKFKKKSHKIYKFFNYIDNTDDLSVNFDEKGNINKTELWRTK